MPEVISATCGICGTHQSRPLHRIRGQSIVQCTHCDLIYTSPRCNWDYHSSAIPLQERRAIYVRHYWPKRRASADRLWVTARRFRLTGCLLDIGCGFGFFLNEARLHGWSARGVEVASDEAAWGSEYFGISIVASLEDESLKPATFDVITLWDVIEHIDDFKGLLRRCSELLRPGGGLFIRTPDANGLLIGPTWWSWPIMYLYWHLAYPANPAEHVYHFTPEMLCRILENEGFRVDGLMVSQDWGERVILGRNPAVTIARKSLMWLAWRLSLPYEFVVTAVKST